MVRTEAASSRMSPNSGLGTAGAGAANNSPSVPRTAAKAALTGQRETMMIVTYLILAFTAGLLVCHFGYWIALLPKPPACTACLRSGEDCVRPLGHNGPHRAYVKVSHRQWQAYVWEDPKAGVHEVGFFYK